MINLRKWRDSLELTQPQMAKYVGVSVHTWRKWEQGQHQPGEAALSLFNLLRECEQYFPAWDTIIELRLNEVLK